MKFRILLGIAFIQLAAIGTASAQTIEHSAWSSWFHTQRFNKHWGASFDGHFRSADHVDYLKTVLLRPSINYYFGNKNVALGYAYIGTNGRSGDVKTFRPESRLFEQLIISQPAGVNTQITHRFRLEQRFLGETATQQSVFSQRFRYFIRAVVPFNGKTAPFTNGAYLALANEIFVNVQNKEKVNNHFFDQNRAFIGIGHRFSKQVDVEAGYLNQYSQQAKAYTINNVMQVTLYTRFGSSK
ncbi:DUF2490 domain-containing protein [Mucilaginibacter calamicampi]|uniref:DUF2490 domain-containing protein n=1 Tax=Mucilaginibacter calamicampi TaxID=1302352 RepID=A0ABW2YVF6_9SPHI